MPVRATKRKGKNGWLSDLVGTKTTVRSVKTGAVSTSKSRYKGYTIFKEKSGDFTVPGLDKSSTFDTLRDAKRFVDYQTKPGMVNGKKKNPSPAVERAYRRAQKLDDAFQAALEKEYGKRAGDMRYQTAKLTPRLKKMARIYQRASKKLHDVTEKERHNPSKFDRCVRDVKKKGGAVSPYAVCTAAGTRNARFAAVGTVGRRKTRSNPDEHVASMSIGGAAAEVYRTTSNAFKAVVKWGKQTSEKIFKGFGQAMAWARDQVQKLAVGKAKNVDPFTAASAIGTYGPKVGKSLDKAGARLSKQLGKIKLSNPMDSAVRLYEEFHGLPSEEVLEYVQKEHYHSVLTGLGPLISIKVLNVFGDAEQLFMFPDPLDADFTNVVQCCSSEDGRQLYLVGGDQELNLKKMKGAFGMTNEDIRDKMLIGTITQLTYRTKKSFELGGKEEIDFFHDLDDDDAFKQNDGVLPVLEYRPLNPSIEIVGGRYKIAKPVAELGNVSPGIVG
jgi:hypothetical protein